MILGQKTRELLDYVLEKDVMVDMSYMQQGQWYVTAAKIVELNSDSFIVKINNTHLLSLSPQQLVGISFQHDRVGGHDKFIFGTTVMPAKDDYNQDDSEYITLELPEEIEVVRKKNFLKVNLPDSMNIEVQLWHRGDISENNSGAVAHVCQGFAAQLISLAADRLEISVSTDQGPDFSKGQSVALRFIPMENETPISFNANIKHVLPSWEAQRVVMELELVGLEASPEGRMVLRRLCNILSRYRAMLHSVPASEVVPVQHTSMR